MNENVKHRDVRVVFGADVELMTRPSWDDYFLDVARTVSARATCPRKSVGCVLVRERRVVATGYNGAMSGEKHCMDVGCLLKNEHCVRVVHSEANAVCMAARHGVSVEGTTAYVTLKPCESCYRLFVNSGIHRIVYAEDYGTDFDLGSVEMESTG